MSDPPQSFLSDPRGVGMSNQPKRGVSVRTRRAGFEHQEATGASATSPASSPSPVSAGWAPSSLAVGAKYPIAPTRLELDRVWRISSTRPNFRNLLVVMNRVQRHVDEPLISVERAEDGERVHQRMLLQGPLGFAGKGHDIDALSLKPFRNLSAREPLARHKRLGCHRVAFSRRQRSSKELCLALRLLLPSWVWRSCQSLSDKAKEQSFGQDHMLCSLAYRPFRGRGLPFPLGIGDPADGHDEFLVRFDEPFEDLSAFLCGDMRVGYAERHHGVPPSDSSCLPEERMRATEMDTIEHYFLRAPSHSAPGGNVSPEVPGQILFSADAAAPCHIATLKDPVRWVKREMWF